jgi:hypothetical protein
VLPRGGGLQDFCQLRSESALRFLLALLRDAGTIAASTTTWPAIRSIGTPGSGPWSGRPTMWGAVLRGTILSALLRTRRAGPDSTLRGLRWVGPKDFVLERGSVETANNRLHFVLCRRFHKRKAFRLLRLVVPNYLNRIRYEIFGGEPLFNVIGGDPDGQIAQKYGKAHSVSCVYSLVGISSGRKEERGPDLFCLPDDNRPICMAQCYSVSILLQAQD